MEDEANSGGLIPKATEPNGDFEEQQETSSPTETEEVPQNDEDEGYYVMEKFNNIRSTRGNFKPGSPEKLEIEIKWKDYDHTQMTWEPLKNIANPDDGIQMLKELKEFYTKNNPRHRATKFAQIETAIKYLEEVKLLSEQEEMRNKLQDNLERVVSQLDQSIRLSQALDQMPEPQKIPSSVIESAATIEESTQAVSKIVAEQASENQVALGVEHQSNQVDHNSPTRNAPEIIINKSQMTSPHPLPSSSDIRTPPKDPREPPKHITPPVLPKSLEQLYQSQKLTATTNPNLFVNVVQHPNKQSETIAVELLKQKYPVPQDIPASTDTLQQLKKVIQSPSRLESVPKEIEDDPLLSLLLNCFCFQTKKGRFDQENDKQDQDCGCGWIERLRKVIELGIEIPTLDMRKTAYHNPQVTFYFSDMTGLPIFIMPSKKTPEQMQNRFVPRVYHHLGADEMMRIDPKWTFEALEYVDFYLNLLLLESQKHVTHILTEALTCTT